MYFGKASDTESDRINDSESDRESDRENGRESAGHSGDIYKLNINKTKRNIKGSAVPAEICVAFTQHTQIMTARTPFVVVVPVDAVVPCNT